jgi:hypothetical protein
MKKNLMNFSEFCRQEIEHHMTSITPLEDNHVRSGY